MFVYQEVHQQLYLLMPCHSRKEFICYCPCFIDRLQRLFGSNLISRRPKRKRLLPLDEGKGRSAPAAAEINGSSSSVVHDTHSLML